MRVLNRPPEGHPVRDLNHEGLMGALEVAENAVHECAAKDDLRLARQYAEQVDTLAAELVARSIEREMADREAEEAGEYPHAASEEHV